MISLPKNGRCTIRRKNVTFGFCLALRSAPLHKHNFLNLSIWAITVLWSANVLMQKVGKAEKTELVNSSLLAWLRKIDVAASLLSHLLTRGEKSMTLGFVNPRGRPRYVKGSLHVSQLKVLARCSSYSPEYWLAPWLICYSSLSDLLIHQKSVAGPLKWGVVCCKLPWLSKCRQRIELLGSPMNILEVKAGRIKFDLWLC